MGLAAFERRPLGPLPEVSLVRVAEFKLEKKPHTSFKDVCYCQTTSVLSYWNKVVPLHLKFGWSDNRN